MAAVFFTFKTVTENQTFFHKLGKLTVVEFLTNRDWIHCGKEAFHSKPMYGTVKDQLLSQTKAIQDIENLFTTRPWLKEGVTNTLLITGMVHDLGPLLTNGTHSGQSDNSDCHEENSSCTLTLHLKPKTCLDLEGERNAKPEVSESFKDASKIAKNTNAQEAVKSTGESLRSKKIRPIGSASKVTSRGFVAPAFDKRAVTSKPQAVTFARYRADVNFNSLTSGKNRTEAKEINGFEELTPLIMNVSRQTSTDEFQEWLSTCESLYVKTTRKEKHSKRLACQTFNTDPSEQVVV